MFSGCYVSFVFSLSTSCLCYSVFLGIICIDTWWGLQDRASRFFRLLSAMVGLAALVCTPEFDMVLRGLVLLRTLSSVVFFIRANFFLFFFFFEVGIVPLILLIMGWGHQPERLQACASFLIYTLVGSLPMFLILCWSSLLHNSRDMLAIKFLANDLVRSNLF